MGFRGSSFIKRSRNQAVVQGACVGGAAMCFSLVIIFLAHAELTRVWANPQTGEPCLLPLSSYFSPASILISCPVFMSQTFCKRLSLYCNTENVASAHFAKCLLLYSNLMQTAKLWGGQRAATLCPFC